MVQGLATVFRSGIFLYAASLVNSFAGFIFWLLVSIIADPGAVGTASAVVGFSMLVAGVLSFGAGAGLQRYVDGCRFPRLCFPLLLEHGNPVGSDLSLPRRHTSPLCRLLRRLWRL
ncbi:hypothetical protein [Hyperthermus butylicus]|uniref:hypothetical protein n=1 Tax=Hyperthermus butylicus TaxID=54248 RepID=UPI000321A8C2|nr:hypothetical protein [Hyperthermus butylicus]